MKNAKQITITMNNDDYLMFRRLMVALGKSQSKLFKFLLEKYAGGCDCG